jgi:Flp pilus assembly protein TadG
MRSALAGLLGRFLRNTNGSTLHVFALSFGPMMALMGAAVEYSKASDDRAGLQRALDAAVLTGAKDGSSQWITVATDAFKSAFRSKTGQDPTPQFSLSTNRYAASVATSTNTALITPLGFKSIEISAAAAALANPGDSDTSCVLTLGQGQALGTASMTFNGAPNVSLTGCTIRSNTSMRCNGQNTGAMSSISTGTTAGCSNPISGANAVGDIYRPLATNITRKCPPTSRANAIWSPSTLPSSTEMVTVLAFDRTEYHVCGNLTLSGSGSLTGAYPNSDTIIVVENGSLTLDRDAAISAIRTAIVLTGTNGTASAIIFPNGNGHGASLTLSPPTNRSDPWAGIAIYQDPALTTGISEDWGPGATLTVDGVVYLPNADITLRGNMASSSSGCPKLVTNTLTIDGGVSLSHSGQACESLKVQQWATPRSSILVQ